MPINPWRAVCSSDGGKRNDSLIHEAHGGQALVQRIVTQAVGKGHDDSSKVEGEPRCEERSGSTRPKGSKTGMGRLAFEQTAPAEWPPGEQRRAAGWGSGPLGRGPGTET